MLELFFRLHTEWKRQTRDGHKLITLTSPECAVSFLHSKHARMIRMKAIVGAGLEERVKNLLHIVNNRGPHDCELENIPHSVKTTENLPSSFFSG